MKIVVRIKRDLEHYCATGQAVAAPLLAAG